MIFQTSPTSAIVKIHNISREFSMLLQILRRRYSRVHFRGLKSYATVCRGKWYFDVVTFFSLFPPACSDGLFRGTRRYCDARGLFLFFFFLQVAFSYFYRETNRVSCLPRIYIRRGLRVSNARRRPSTRFQRTIS